MYVFKALIKAILRGQARSAKGLDKQLDRFLTVRGLANLSFKRQRQAVAYSLIDQAEIRISSQHL